MTNDRHSDLPLFTWKPVCTVVAFPLSARIGKIRDVASKLAAKTTERHADYYVSQVTEALIISLTRAGLSTDEQSRQVRAFWSKVEQETARLSHRGTGNHPRGAA